MKPFTPPNADWLRTRDQFFRILRLIRLFALEPELHSLESLADRFRTSTRTIRRDLTFLNAFGFEVSKEPIGRRMGYHVHIPGDHLTWPMG